MLKVCGQPSLPACCGLRTRAINATSFLAIQLNCIACCRVFNTCVISSNRIYLSFPATTRGVWLNTWQYEQRVLIGSSATSRVGLWLNVKKHSNRISTDWSGHYGGGCGYDPKEGSHWLNLLCMLCLTRLRQDTIPFTTEPVSHRTLTWLLWF